MYLNFYGLRDKPFNLTPDPKFLYLPPGHREALAQLLYGVQESKGFMVLTGEVGTGKTTLLQALLQKFDSNTEAAYVFNSKMSFDGILEYILEDFGIAKNGESTQAQRLFALNSYLVDRLRTGQRTVLVFDEAQNFDPEILENVRLLSNFETATDKLLQILLVGQPELRAKLDLPELRQLKQRIALRCRIPPLTPEQTREYIRHRLRVAGAEDLSIFSDKAILRINDHAGGIPRVVNIICDHCLLIGYADQKRRIDQDVVAQAIDYMEDGELPEQGRRSSRVATRSRFAALRWGAAIVAAGLLGWGLGTASFRALSSGGFLP
jgi:general secretion pathway protein A